MSGAAPLTSSSPTPERRKLRFESPADVLADVARIASAERAGRLRRTGNWAAGQAVGHLAAWINFGFDGYPVSAPPELAERARARKPTALREGLLVGFRMPGIEGGTAATELMELSEAVPRYERAFARLVAGTPSHPHPFFGPLTNDEWMMLHLRHAELHLGFQHPQ
jgi:hypothetical protein